MKKWFIIIIMLIIPSLAFSDTFTLRIGYFVPFAKSDLWDIEFENMDFSKNNFQRINLGFSYEGFITNEISLEAGMDNYNRLKWGMYNEYVGVYTLNGEFAFPNNYIKDFSISHSFNVSMMPFFLSLKITPLGRRSRVIPYIGGGVNVYLWSVRIYGDMIDFSDTWYYYDEDIQADVEVYPIYEVNAQENDNWAIGYHAFLGFMMPLANRITFDFEFRYNYGKGEFKDAYLGFQPFDLGGYQISVSLNYWF
ncbi:MAG: hypothetical protein ACOC5F_02235 [Candidatus Aminicenantaceae bacterium]